jgi:hypothetical protein
MKSPTRHRFWGTKSYVMKNCAKGVRKSMVSLHPPTSIFTFVTKEFYTRNKQHRSIVVLLLSIDFLFYGYLIFLSMFFFAIDLVFVKLSMPIIEYQEEEEAKMAMV